MNEIESNKAAWGLLSRDHYETFKKRLCDGTHLFNAHIERELGDITGKKIIHLQCNTGADTLLLAKKGAQVTGVDFVADNVMFAAKLAADLSIKNAEFIEADIMKLADTHHEKYDIVFTSEGALGWLPDLKRWAQTVRSLLKDGGSLYVFDSHPFFLSLDEQKLASGEFAVKYPYFGKKPDVDDGIGGYAAERKNGVKAYFWMHTVSNLINYLVEAGLTITFFNEYSENFWNPGGMEYNAETRLYRYPFNTDGFPVTFSLGARTGTVTRCG